MVRGLNLFKEHFRNFTEQYVLIGGTACFILFEDAGQEFRATKDLDIVLCIEALTMEFIRAFGEFISLGAYQVKEKGSGAKILYRFTNPKNSEYPVQIELFSGKPLGMELPEASSFAPIKVGDEYISLSALLMNEDYYHLIQIGKDIIEGITLLKPAYLLLFKAKAWMDLTDRKAAGDKVHSADIKKHVEDVFRLLALLPLSLRIDLTGKVKEDMKEFIGRCSEYQVNEFTRFGLGMTQPDAVKLIHEIYRLDN
jgi:hypothetical protein